MTSADARSRGWNLAATCLAALTAVAVALLPTVSWTSTDAEGVVTSGRSSLLSDEGAGLLVVLVIPVVCVGLPLLLRSPRRARAARQVVVGLLAVMVVLGALSIGIFFAPTLIAMIVSVGTSPREHR